MDVAGILNSMCDFAAEYCLAKCVRTMFAGLALLPAIFLIRGCNRGKRAEVNFYALLLLLPAAFTGMSKLFFQTRAAKISGFLYGFIRPVHGKIYFGVMAVLLAGFLWRNHCLRRSVQGLPVWEDREELGRMISLVAGRERFGWRRRYLNRVRVYITEERVSPFSGGLLRPYMVIPRDVLTDWREDQRGAVICHELVHLKEGHILWMTLFELLKIYWWINPLIYLCDKLLREDMERICDEQCIRYANVSCGAYGRALLGMIALMRGAGPEGTLCFSEKKDFLTLKKRICSLAAFDDEGRCEAERCGRHGVIFAGLFAAVFAVIAATSYPRYTRLDEIALYDESLTLLDYDSEELRSAVAVSGGRLVIDEERFGELLAQKSVEGDYVYVSFDAIMKVPGSGGCGNAGMVAVGDYGDILYLSKECMENTILEFWLKYLI